MEFGPYKRSSEDNTGEISHGVRADCKSVALCKVGFDSHLTHSASVVKWSSLQPFKLDIESSSLSGRTMGC